MGDPFPSVWGETFFPPSFGEIREVPPRRSGDVDFSSLPVGGASLVQGRLMDGRGPPTTCPFLSLG